MQLTADSPKCSGCRVCLTICPLAHFHDNNTKKAALKAEGRFPAPGGFKVTTCNQCGDCAAVCPVEAIHFDQGVYWINPDECTNCLACVEACPLDVMFTHPDLSFPIKCDACGECTRYCGTEVLHLERKESEVIPPPHIFSNPTKAPFPLGGYAGWILRVNLTDKTFKKEKLEVRLAEEYLGGRGFAARLLYDELEPGIDPLGPKNKVVVAGGPLSGLFVPGAGKTEFAAKSPATGGWGDSSVGGMLSAELKQAGYDAIIVEGSASSPVYLFVDDDRVELRDASAYWGKGSITVEKMLKDELGEHFQVATIGPAGEAGVKFACITHDFGRQAGRTGIGAVLGAKKLKAIAVHGTRGIAIANLEGFMKAAKDAFQDCFDSAGRQVWQRYGPAGVTTWSKEVGAFPTRNFTSGQLEGYEALGGEPMRQKMVVADKACFGCPVPCGKYSHSGNVYVEGPEYETTALIGGNCGLTNMDDVAYANYLCDELGLDTISAGNAIAFAMECYQRGIITGADTGGMALRFGDAKAVNYLIEKIARRQGLGVILAEGVKFAAARFGQGSDAFAIHVKGLEVSGYESHQAPAMLLSYMTADVGAHHNKSWAITHDIAAGRQLIEGKAEKVIELQHIRPLFDCLGACRLQWVELSMSLEHYPKILSALFGKEVTWQDLMKVSERVWNLTRLFWLREVPGFGRSWDYPPARFWQDPIEGGPTDGSVMTRAQIDQLLDEYYARRGWDQNGVPTPAKLAELRLP